MASPPPGPEQREAARRGRLLHALFERLPDLPADRRRVAADNWLERSAGIQDRRFRQELIEDSCRVIENPDFASLFTPDSLGEAPIAAVIGGGIVVSGTIDRLLIGEDLIRLADFKTGRHVPGKLDDIPKAHLRQMAAYREALRTIFPDRPVEAALLYTAGPILHRLPGRLLTRHLPVEG